MAKAARRTSTPKPSERAPAVWERWRAVQRQLTLGRMARGLLRARGLGGFDAIRGVRESPWMVDLEALLHGINETDRTALIELAKLNLERQSYYARLVLLAYVTVPLTLIALAAQLSPGGLKQILTGSSYGAACVILGPAVAVVIRFVAEARARALLLALQLLNIR